jgi:serine/threonine protein phosphatase PrpC
MKSKCGKYVVDHHYMIGHRHKVCEDYAASGINKDGIPWAVISDGCSGADDTDVGARVLVQAFKNYMENAFHGSCNDKDQLHHDIYYHIVFAMGIYITQFNINPETFCATIRAIFVHDDQMFSFHYGDGITIMDEGDGYMKLDYASTPYIQDGHVKKEAPYYLLTSSKIEYAGKYLEKFGESLIEFYDNGHVREITVNEYVGNVRSFINATRIDTSKDSVAMVTSDGFQTYTDDSGSPVGESEILTEMISLKGGKRPVLKRMTMMADELGKKGITHYDDISCAAIKIKWD